MTKIYQATKPNIGFSAKEGYHNSAAMLAALKYSGIAAI